MSLTQSKRALPLAEVEEEHSEGVPQLSFTETIEGKSRRTAAGTFFELLALASKDYITVQQEEPYGDVVVRKGVRMTATSYLRWPIVVCLSAY